LTAKKRLRSILPRHKLIGFSRHRKTFGTKYFGEAERRGLEGIMAKCAESTYVSGGRTIDWLKIKTSKRQEVVIVDFTAPRRSRPFFGALVLAVREKNAWRYIGHVGTGFSHKTLEELHGAQGGEVSISRKGITSSRHDLGQAVLGGRSQVYRMDDSRGNAASCIPGASHRQAGARRCPGNTAGKA
jgi:bifunctional non-homologous end joining protein LigD